MSCRRNTQLKVGFNTPFFFTRKRLELKHIIKVKINSTLETFEISEAGKIKWTSALIEMESRQRVDLIRMARTVSQWLTVNGGISFEVEEEA